MKSITITPPTLKDIRLSKGIYAAIEVARMVGVEYGEFQRRIYGGDIPRPSLRINNGKRLHYTPQEVATIRSFFD